MSRDPGAGPGAGVQGVQGTRGQRPTVSRSALGETVTRVAPAKTPPAQGARKDAGMGIRLPHRRPALPAGAVPALSVPVPAVAAGASTAQTPAARRAGRTPGSAAPASRSIEAAAAPAAATYRDTGAPPAHADGSGPTCDLASECQYDPEGFADGADGETVPRRAQRLRDTLDRWELAVLNPWSPSRTASRRCACRRWSPARAPSCAAASMD